MKLLLASHLPHTFINGGAQKSLRSSLEHLARRGHDVTVVCPTADGISPFGSVGDVSLSRLNGVEVVQCSRGALREAQSRARLGKFDVALVPAEDPWQRPARMLAPQAPVTVVVSQTPATLPFGPGAAYPNARNRALLESCLMIASSRFLTGYVSRWSDVAVEHVTLSTVTDVPKQPDLDLSVRPFVMMINPSPIKGLGILLAVARALPMYRFAVVPGWATEAETLAVLRELRNIVILPATQDIFEHLRVARLLLVPSVWLENVPLTVTEAMLAGVPVVGSQIGGVAEVARGEGDFIDVRQAAWIRDGRAVRLEVPDQRVDGWVSVVRERLSESEDEWRQRSLRARAAAEAHLAEFDSDHLASTLANLLAHQQEK